MENSMVVSKDCEDYKERLYSVNLYVTVSLFLQNIKIGIRYFKNYGKPNRIYATEQGISLSIVEFYDLVQLLSVFIETLIDKNAAPNFPTPMFPPGENEAKKVEECTVWDFKYWTARFEEIDQNYFLRLQKNGRLVDLKYGDLKWLEFVLTKIVEEIKKKEKYLESLGFGDTVPNNKENQPPGPLGLEMEDDIIEGSSKLESIQRQNRFHFPRAPTPDPIEKVCGAAPPPSLSSSTEEYQMEE